MKKSANAGGGGGGENTKYGPNQLVKYKCDTSQTLRPFQHCKYNSGNILRNQYNA